MAHMVDLSSEIDFTQGFVGKIHAALDHGPVGTCLKVRGAGLPQDQELQLVWETYDLDWNLEMRDSVAWNEFLGLNTSTQYHLLDCVRTSPEGSFEKDIVIPEDYGGYHDIYIVEPESMRKLNKCGFMVDASAEIDVCEGVMGTPISITVRGLNPAHPLEGWYQLCYDNKSAGYLTAVTTRGTAVVEIPATGLPGTHLITIEKGSFGEPFLGVETTPFYYTKTFHFQFELLDGDPVFPEPIQEQIQEDIAAPPLEEDGKDPKIGANFASFPAHMAFAVRGVGFPPRHVLSLWWHDVHGDRVSEQQDGTFGTGFTERETLLTEVTSDDNGQFEARLVHEGTQGGPHAITATHEDKTLARTYVHVSRRPHPIKPKSGPVGTKIQIEVEGVGWTEYENIVAVDYDNAYMGYKCGNDMMGRALIQFRGAGSPGWHIIDLYPAIYRNQNFAEAMEMPYIYQKPILTWRDHPQGFHARYMFYIDHKKESDT